MSNPMQKAFTPFLWFLVTIFFIRALLPTGFMPDISGQHMLAICSGDGLKTIIVDGNNQPLPSSPDQSPNRSNLNHCPFAPFSAAFLLNPYSGDSLVDAPVIISKEMIIIVAENIRHTSLNNHHQSRAPPTLS